MPFFPAVRKHCLIVSCQQSRYQDFLTSELDEPGLILGYVFLFLTWPGTTERINSDETSYASKILIRPAGPSCLPLALVRVAKRNGRLPRETLWRHYK